jgi:hypothetical protein
VFIATFNNLSVLSQYMKLSFIGGGKRKKPPSRIWTHNFSQSKSMSQFNLSQQSSQPVLLQMSMSICNKWLVCTTVKFSHAFLSSTDIYTWSTLSIFPELKICMLLPIDMDIWRRTGCELCWERLNWDILLLWMFGRILSWGKINEKWLRHFIILKC